jgi:phenylacetate-CoA ligase
VNDFVNLIRSAVPGIAWPAIPGPEAAVLLALQFQLEHSQWLAPERLREVQFRQLGVLLNHAYETVPYYRERWRGVYDPARPLTPEVFSRLPLLTRSELQTRFEALKSTGVPAAHGPVAESRTSGSTGMPVRVLKTALVQLFWQASVLREHQWFKRDLTGKLASIRQGVVEGEADGWGPATDVVARTGPSATLPISADVDAQLKWLERQQPDYLLTYPSNLAELLKSSAALGFRPARLREARTFGEILTSETRALCRETWGVPVADAYTSVETGYLALQCPQQEHYHVLSESVLLEVLDEKGAPCRPGEVGRVVVTPLHNYAMPLVRYEIGDYAEAGEPCRCGRGLPVLVKILGRSRNMLALADGTRYWPAFGSAGLAELAPILQQQLVQKDFHTLEARLVTARPLAPAEEESLRRHIQARLPAPFAIRFSYCDAIGRSNGGKFEDFVCELRAPR